LLTIQIEADEFKTLCEIVGRAQYRDSTSNRPDEPLKHVVERLKKVAEDIRQDDARRELL
jgi:hypothetical protein